MKYKKDLERHAQLPIRDIYTYLLFKNVQLLLILNTECFRRKTSNTLEMNFENLKYISTQH